MYQLVPHVQTRVDIWLDPFADPAVTGYQIVQALYAFARGGPHRDGAGRRAIADADPGRPHRLPARRARRGAGARRDPGDPRAVPRRHRARACGSPRRRGDEFRALLAAGLSLVVGVQAFIIAAGNLKLIPLTGITLPFISYGGSSLLVNGIVVGLLLALSDKGVEPPPAPKPPGRLARLDQARGRPDGADRPRRPQHRPRRRSR